MPSIELCLTIFMLVIMLLSLIVGLIQGFKKNMYNFCAMILFWIIFWCTAPFVKGNSLYYSENLYQSLSGVLPSLEDGANCTNLMEYLIHYIAQLANLDPATLNDPSVTNTIIAMVQGFFKMIYLVFLAIFYHILKVILYHCVFAKWCNLASKKNLRSLNKHHDKLIEKNADEQLIKKVEKNIEREEKKIKRNKIYRPLGMASGLFRGFVSSFLIICIFNSFIRILPEEKESGSISASTQQGQSDTELSFYDFILSYCDDDPFLEEIIGRIKDYRSGNLMKMTGIKIGNKSVDELFMDSILSGKSEDYSFVIREELSGIVQIAENAYYLTDGFDMENFNAAALNDEQVTYVKNILKILSNDHLVNNLGSVVVGITISLDAVKEYMPDNISGEEYQDINWNKELKTIAEVVDLVYGLGDDLSKLDYFDLDTQTVNDIVVKLSSLQSINFLGHVGCDFAIKQLVKDDKYSETIDSIENKLASLAVNKEYGKMIESYSDLYTQFSDIYHDEVFSKYKENGKVTNIAAALTSQNVESYNNIINTVFETNFVKEILPDVMTIIKNEYIPAEYASLINPSIYTSDQYKEEITTVLQIVSDLVTEKETGVIHPFETIETYDFELLRNFSCESVIQSDLLSYAMIKIFIDTSKSQGILQQNAKDIAKYVKVPDSLAQDCNPQTHRFADKWYGNDGELYIMLDTIKNCGSNLKNYKHPADSIVEMLSAIDSTELMKSDVLYYTLNSLLKDYQDLIIIPVDCTSTSADTLNGIVIKNMVKRDAIVEVLDVITNPNIIDFEQLYVYFEVDENGQVATEPTDKEYVNEDNKEHYVVKLDVSSKNLMNLLTSKKLYDPSKNDETNLNTLFKSSILRATLTNILNENAGDYIRIPSSASDSKMKCLILDKENIGGPQLVEKNIDIIKQDQFRALVMAIDDLKIDLNALIEEPIDIIDSLSTSNGEIKPQVNAIFGNLDHQNSKYSSILHATLSKYVLDFAQKDSGSLNIVIPDGAKDAKDQSLITSSETVNLIKSLTIIGKDVLKDNNLTQEQLVDDIMKKVIDNHQALDSMIIRATLTDYMNSTGDITIPENAYDSQKITKKEHIVDMLSAIDTLKDVKEKQTGQTIRYSDLLNVDNLTISMLTQADSDTYQHAISNSLIIRKILSDQVRNNEIDIPTSVQDSYGVITMDESKRLIAAVSSILDENDTIRNINIDSITIKRLQERKNVLLDSKIVCSLFTSELEKQEDICIPSTAYDDQMISKEELSNVVDGMGRILDENSLITKINVNEITIAKVHSAKNNVIASSILNATITKQLKAQEDIIIPSLALMSSNEQLLTENEIDSLFDGLNVLFAQSSIQSIDVNSITIAKIQEAKLDIEASAILNGTITKQIKNQNNIQTPDSAFVNATDKELLTKQEIGAFIDTLSSLFEQNTTIISLPVDNITFGNLNRSSTQMVKSIILKATVTEQIKDKGDILLIPNEAYDDNHQIVLKDDEVVQIFNALEKLFGEEQFISDISNVSEIGLTRISNHIDDISKSLVLRSTITNELTKMSDVKIPTSTIENKTHQNSAIKVIKEADLCDLFKALSCMNIENINTINSNNIKIPVSQKSILSRSTIMRATLSYNVRVNDRLVDVLTSDVTKDTDYNDHEIVVINATELEHIIDAFDILSSDGNISITINLATIQQAAADGSLVNILNSNTLRMIISDLISPLAPQFTPVVENVYKLGAEVVQVSEHAILTKEDILSFANM